LRGMMARNPLLLSAEYQRTVETALIALRWSSVLVML
jgi:hypothetical protein